MEISVVDGRELDTELVSAWSRLLSGRPELASPFLRPEFAIAVAAVRADVRIAVLEDGGEIVGFLPFQKGRFRTGRPLAAPLCECQAVIASPELEYDARELVSGCGLTALEYDHLLISQGAFRDSHGGVEEAPVMDLTGGSEAYRAALSARKTDVFRQSERKARKLAREIGPLRFEARVEDPAALRTLLEWKSGQARRTRIFDVFRFEWPHRVVERVHAVRNEDFEGMLSGLFAGERLVAAQMGLRSRSVWHWWLPSYDPELGHYSPGLVLLLMMIPAAESLGLGRIELGKGPETYKRRFMTHVEHLAYGRVECPSLVTAIRKIRRRSMSALRSSPIARPVDAFARAVRMTERRLRGH